MGHHHRGYYTSTTRSTYRNPRPYLYCGNTNFMKKTNTSKKEVGHIKIIFYDDGTGAQSVVLPEGNPFLVERAVSGLEGLKLEIIKRAEERNRYDIN